MTDANKIALSIVVGSTLIAVALFLALKSPNADRERQPMATDGVLSASPTSNRTPVVAAASARRTPTMTMVGLDLFINHWNKGDYAERAKACWKLAARYPEAPYQYVFKLKVSARGRVIEALADSETAYKVAPKVYSCVIAIIKEMKFPPSGQAHDGRGQVNRPNAK